MPLESHEERDVSGLLDVSEAAAIGPGVSSVLESLLAGKKRAVVMAYRFHSRRGMWGLGAASPSPTVQQALQSASSSYGVPLPLLTAVAKAESGFNPGVTSSAGARGLMQIMPANDAFLGVSNPFDPQQSANAGAKYLSQLYGQYGDWNTALIAYNEGPGNLASKGVFPSSQQYAAGILADAGIDGAGPGPGPADVGGASMPTDSGVPASDTSGLSGTAWLGLGAAAAALLWYAAG